MPPRKKPSADMFDHAAEARAAGQAPLAARMRPATLEEFVGQEHLVGQGRLLRNAIEADQLPSMVLWGPPGSGKTTLARIIAGLTQSHFEPVSAVSSGVADLRRVVAEAKQRLGMNGLRTVLFIDEIHRFNKAQQDAALPYVEDGTVTLIGATTENPSFQVISPLLSRSRVYRLEPLSPEQVEALLRRALADTERGLGAAKVEIDDDTLHALATVAGGDARIALNALELAAQSATSVRPERPAKAGQSKGRPEPAGSAARPEALEGRSPAKPARPEPVEGRDPESTVTVTLADIEEALQHRAALYDRAGDWHYDIASAFIKSLRGSDPDAALYWLARMLEGGEDPLFVARRLVILASEDVGLADPQALQVAVAAQQAVHFIGMPEGYYPLAQATIYLATAPKSNSAGQAYGRALQDAKATLNEPVPLHLRNAVTPLLDEMGHGRDYKYDHDFPDHHSGQRHLPETLAGRTYYVPTSQGHEAQIAEWMERLRAKDDSPRST